MFALAREAAQREPRLVESLDTLIMGFTAEEFLEALPSLRLAFPWFTPREKYHLARTLLDLLGEPPTCHNRSNCVSTPKLPLTSWPSKNASSTPLHGMEYEKEKNRGILHLTQHDTLKYS